MDQREPRGAVEFPRAPLATGGIRRAAVVRRLSTVADDVSLVLVVAPPGYGKTTAVSQWARTTRSQVAWVDVSQEHAGRQRLVKDLAVALLRIGPLGDVLGGLAASPRDIPPEEAAERLASAAAAVGVPVTIVLDDLHLLKHRPALDLVLAVAVRLAPGSRIVAIADREPRLQIGRLRSEGRCLDIGPEDLAFSREETAALLAADVRLGHVDAEAVDDLHARTEGWPAGLHLATLVLPTPRGSPEQISEQMRGIRGTSRYIADYFRETVLARLSVDTVRFLMRTAVLDRICAPLCDAVLGTSGSAAWLDELGALGLFLVPLDEHGEWFRYQRLFAEMLRGELRRREPGEDARVLRAASLWYESQDRPGEAIRHAIAAGDALFTARMIAAHTHELHSRGRMAQVRQWLEGLDWRILELYPPVAVSAVWAWALTGEAPRARRALRLAEESSFDGVMPDDSASLTSATTIARAALAPDGVDAMLTDAARAVALEPPGSPWHTLARVLEGEARLLTGSTREANLAFERAAAYGREKQRPGVSLALALRSLTAAADGDWSTAATCADEAHRLVIDQLRASMTSIAAHAAVAQVRLHRGDTQEALHQLRDAERLYRDAPPIAFPWLSVQLAVVLGRLFAALGSVPAAERKLTDARRSLALLPTQGVLPGLVEDFAAELEAGDGEGDPVEAFGLTSAELRVLRRLPTHHTLGEIGDELVVSRNTVKSQVAAIYRKLDVANRAEAVRRAHEVGLLDG
jgi:LuxR family maltose regulon positive regulatory protein